jgi:hypothetical protein
MNNFFWIPEIFEADVQEKTRIEILDTNSERHSIVERAEEKKRGFFFFGVYTCFWIFGQSTNI